jgi:YVTN family beta-propeller protein
MLRIRFKYAMIAAIGFLALSCNTDEEVVPVGKYENGVLISNEGGFFESDGSAGFFDLQTEETNNKVFETENGRPFGGLMQSIGIHGNIAYLIDNKGSRVEIVDANTFESLGTLHESLSGPRYFISEGQVGFVSNWGVLNFDTFQYDGPMLSILNTETNIITQTIEVPAQPEGMIISGGNLYVSSQGSSTITVIDIESLEAIETIEVAFGPSHFVEDKNGNIWVTCMEGLLMKIDPRTNEVTEEIQVPNLLGKLAIDGAGENIYLLTNTWAPDFSYTENAVLKLNIGTPENQASIFSTKNLYGIGVDPESDIIYLANSNAFQGNGTIIRIDSNGTEIDNFPAGRGPNGFVFR